MTGRERVLNALNGIEPDRCPRDLGGCTFTSITLEAYKNLVKYLGMEEYLDQYTLVSRMTQVVYPPEAVLERLNIDTRGVVLGKPDNWTDIEHDERTYEDEWHVVREKPEGALYYDMKKSPFDGLMRTIEEAETIQWPDPTDPGRYRNLKAQFKALADENKYARMLMIGSGPVHMTQYLRGFEEWFMDIGLNPSLFKYYMDKTGEILLETTKRALDEAGEYIDIVCMSDDLAGQNGLLFSPETYREFIKPIHKKLVDLAHSYGVKFLFHSCGSVVPLLDDLVDVGIDALNPIQVSAANMDCDMLKEKYGDKMAFWGGVDSQDTMPYGSADDVAAEANLRISQLSKNGGYILGCVHNIQPDVPPENIVALFEAGITAAVK